MTVLRFASLTEYLGKAPALSSRSEGASWDLGVSASQALVLARNGDPTLVAATISAIDAISPTLITQDRPRWEMAIAGPLVSVPAYLSGCPMAMRHRVPRGASVRHVSIYVELSTMGHVKAADMLTRGQAILALVEYLQATQINVDLNLVLDTDGTDDKSGDLFQVIPVESRPLDLSVAGFALAHPAFARNVGYAVAKKHGFTGNTSRSLSRLGRGAYIPFIRETLEMEPRDVYIQELFRNDLSATDPKSWIEQRISQIETK